MRSQAVSAPRTLSPHMPLSWPMSGIRHGAGELSGPVKRDWPRRSAETLQKT
jgi:hypothetical protein